MYNIIAQIIGIIAPCALVLSFQMKNNKWLFMLQTLNSLLFVINFFMLGSYTGALLNFINMFKCGVLALGKKWSKPWVCVLFQLLFIAAGIFTYDGLPSILTTLAQVVTTATMWSRNGKVIRLTNFFVSSPAWMFNNIYYFSIGGIIAETLSMLSVIVSFIRFGINGFENEKKEKVSSVTCGDCDNKL